MKRITYVIPAGCFILAFAVAGSNASAQIPDASLYVANKTCILCHKKDETGNQYQKWLDGPHAKAFTLLGEAKAKETAAKLGIADPQASGKCLKCHSTAYNFTEERQTDMIEPEEGVTCQSCHGPGANYKKKEIMEDHDAAVAAGMIFPAKEKSCALCHNDQNPNWNPERYTTKDGQKVGFDVEQAYEKIKHPRPTP